MSWGQGWVQPVSQETDQPHSDLEGTFPMGLFLGSHSTLVSGTLIQVIAPQRSASRGRREGGRVSSPWKQEMDYITMGKMKVKCGVKCV